MLKPHPHLVLRALDALGGCRGRAASSFRCGSLVLPPPRVEGSGRTGLACPTPSRKPSTNQPGCRTMTEAVVSFAGNLADDPEPRHTESRIARAMFR
jgi:hypothetical protein